MRETEHKKMPVAWTSSYRLRLFCVAFFGAFVFITSVYYIRQSGRSSRPWIHMQLAPSVNREENAIFDPHCDFTAFRCLRHLERGHVDVLVKRPKKVEFIHQSWKTAELPSRFVKWSNTWKKCFPKARYILWTDDDNRNFIQKHYPWFLKRYDSLPANIYRADAVRYLYLFHYGGIYSDLDNECLRPFDHLLLNSTMAFGAMSGAKNVKEGGFVQNSFMYSEARHPMWLELAHRIMVKKNGPHPEELTGPHALVAIINEYRRRLKDDANIAVYPPLYFNPFSWMNNKVKECKHFNQMSNKELEICRNTFRNTSYVVQYHTHTWGGGKILK